MSDRNATNPRDRSPLVPIVAPCVLVVVGAAAYANSLQGVFLFDDYKHIVDNEAIRDLWSPGGYLSDRRPSVQATFAINYAISQLRPWSYHVVNVAIHVAAALTLFGIVRRTIGLITSNVTNESRASSLALVIALLWMLHPLQTQSVTYLIQRGESLMGLCYLLSLYLVIRGATASSSWPWYVMAVVACAAGMGAKAVMITAPVVILVYDRMFLAPSWRALLRRRGVLHAALMATWGVLLLCGVAAAVLSSESKPEVNVGFAYKGITPVHYALTQPKVILHYLRLSVWPDVLCLDYQWAPVSSLREAAVPLAVVVLLLLAALVAVARRHWLGFAGAWFFLVLAPTSSIVPIKDVIFEHRMYLPLAAVVTVVVAGAYAVLRHGFDRLGVRADYQRVIVALLVVAAAISLGWRTIDRNRDYRSAATMWQSVIEVRPESDRAHLGLGAALYREGRAQEAIPCFQRAIDLTPKYADAHYNMGIAAASLRDWDMAVTSYRRAAALAPTRPRYGLALGELLSFLGRFEEAAEAYRNVLAVQPDSLQARVGLANALADAGHYADAVAAFERALDAASDSVDLLINHGNALRKIGRYEQAITQYRRAIAIDETKAAAHANLGATYGELGRYAESAKALERAIALEPDLLPPYRALATAYLRLDDATRARRVLEELLRRDPKSSWAQSMLRRISESVPKDDRTRDGGE